MNAMKRDSLISQERKDLEMKRDELIIDLTEQGYTTQQLRTIFNKHPHDIEVILKKHGYGIIAVD